MFSVSLRWRMSVMAPRIMSNSIFYSPVCSGSKTNLNNRPFVMRKAFTHHGVIMVINILFQFVPKVQLILSSHWFMPWCCPRPVTNYYLNQRWTRSLEWVIGDSCLFGTVWYENKCFQNRYYIQLSDEKCGRESIVWTVMRCACS